MIGKNITESRFFIIWRILWTVVSPLFLIVLVIFTMRGTTRLNTGTKDFPYWTEVMGIIITVSTISGSVLWAVYLFIDALVHKKVRLVGFFFFEFKINIIFFFQPLKSLIMPNEDWVRILFFFLFYNFSSILLDLFLRNH
jgi:hypothetical protein